MSVRRGTLVQQHQHNGQVASPHDVEIHIPASTWTAASSSLSLAAAAATPACRIRLSSQQQVVGLLVADTVLSLCHHADPKLWIYSKSTGQLIKTCAIPALLYPTGLGALDSGHKKLVLASCAPNSLHFLTLSPGRDIKTHRAQPIGFAPRCISVNRGNSDSSGIEIAVANCSDNSIVICNAIGHIQRVVTISGCDVGLLYWASRTDVGYVVTDTCNGQVMWTGLTGNVVRRYLGTEEEPLRHPSQAFQNSSGDIMLLDHYSHKIQIIGEAEPTSVLSEKDGIHSPDCMCLDERANLLYAAHGTELSKEIIVYRYSVLVNRGTCEPLTR